ncbi:MULTISPECIES: Fur family transcriptional regulator [Alteribacter]|uniref:Transcriptional repressor n=1 Tax=Alteribacter keqinensis TaxID=2483800 RepID=A0A3M7TUG6_9BACI|nr:MULTISPECIES: Fur family transcriptional regulator [Alteribacter]MBM7097070.1 transcriptional repressor [Alteribacter salitolerans]RNA68901.1 transcriptional repressor [Alteribacter keqinensis]
MDVKEALTIMKDKGYKYTDKREDILTLFSDEKRYLAAKDVLASLQARYSGLSFDTIYRNLSLFTELGILEETELEGEKKFRFACSTSDHHHHLICVDCGKTKHIHNCPMDAIEDDADGFKITGHKFEIYGYCGECGEKRA